MKRLTVVFQLDGLHKFTGVGIVVRSEDEPSCSGYQLSRYWFQKMKDVKQFHNYQLSSSSSVLLSFRSCSLGLFSVSSTALISATSRTFLLFINFLLLVFLTVRLSAFHDARLFHSALLVLVLVPSRNIILLTFIVKSPT